MNITSEIAKQLDPPESSTAADSDSKTKSFRSAGGLRYALSSNQPGSWASDHRAEAEHLTNWTYIAVRAICLQAMKATVSVFDDSGPNGEMRKSHRQIMRKRWRNDPSMRIIYKSYWQAWRGTTPKSLYGMDQQKTTPLSDDSLLSKLMKRPNPTQSGAIFRYEQVMQLQSTGTCIVWNVPNKLGKTIERYVIPTAVAVPVDPTADMPRGGFRVDPSSARFRSPMMDAQGFVEMSGYFNAIGKVLPVEQCQIIRWPHPILKDDGLSPMAAGAMLIDCADGVIHARWAQMDNGFEPSIVITLPPDITPSQEELDDIVRQFQEKYAGAANHRKVFVTSGDKVVALNTTPKDMDYSNGSKDTRDAVLALIGTPPVAAGIQEAGAYAAYYASLKQFVDLTCQPIFDLLAEEDTGWFSEFRPDPREGHAEEEIREYREGTTVEIEGEPIDDPDILERQLTTDIAAKAIDVDEIRAMRGRPLWGGEKGRRIAGEVPVATGIQQAQAGIQSDHPNERNGSTEFPQPGIGIGSSPPPTHSNGNGKSKAEIGGAAAPGYRFKSTFERSTNHGCE